MTQTMKPFCYERPEPNKPKKIVWLGKTDHLFATIQVITRGGESNLHSHTHLDGLWYVLKGRARFYSDQTTLAANIGPGEGVLIPRGVKYWFESAGDEPLEILQVEGSDKAIRTHDELMSDRNDFTPVKRGGAEHVEAAPKV